MVNGMIDPLSLVDSAQPVSKQSHDIEETSFCDFCMVCDKLISEKVKGNVTVTPVEDEDKPKKPKKKAAGGKVYIKNPDGTILTKTANGTKVTRPGLKRNTSSANRLAAVAADHASTIKVQPLTRSKTMDPAPTQEPVITRTTSSSSSNSPQSTKTAPSPAQPSKSLQDEYRSNVYCSLDCELQEKGASSATYKQIARSLSYDLGLTSKETLERLLMSGLPDQKEYAPPSPLFISGSDTSSNAGQDGPACSAPNTLGFFKLSREGPDDAWNDVQRQRRSSMAPAVRPTSLARHQSNTSTNPGWGDVSSDSLSSLWNTNGSEQELDLSRSTSNGPKGRVSFAADTDRANLWAQRRSMSQTSQKAAPLAMATKPAMNRSSLSTTSLTASPGRGDALTARDSISKDTVELLHSYNAAFPVRESTSNSYKQKGFVLPGSGSPISTPSSRRASMSANIMQRGGTGTIRAKKTSEPTWDSFGRKEIEERQIAREMRRGSSHEREESQTPKQTLAKVDGKWTVVYGETSPRIPLHRSVSRGSDASRRSSDSRSTLEHRSPRPSLGTSLSSNYARTPVTSAMAPPAAIPVRQRRDGNMTPSSSLPSRTGSTVTIPDLASLRIGSSGCVPFLSKSPVVNRGFDWTAHEQQGGKTYALPPNIKVDRSKAGLFYFQN